MFQRILKIYLIGLAILSFGTGKSFSSEDIHSPHSTAAAPLPQNLRYTVLPSQDPGKVRLKIEGIPSPSPNHLILKIKKQNQILGLMNVHLTEYTPEKSVYTGIVPAHVLITGGITFDLAH